MQTTPQSLLARLGQPHDADAWNRFVDLYTPLIYHWAKRLRLDTVERADFVQDVFAILISKLPDFQYQPSKRFRGWLWTVVVNCWRLRNRQFLRTKENTNHPEIDQQVSPDTMEQIDEEDYQNYLVDRALRLMQNDFHETTWKACWQLVVENRAAKDVATELGISVNSVYVSKSRVLRHLRRELDGLLE